MLRRIRNFLFDIKDLVIVVAIISVLFFAVTWKVNETLNVNFEGSNGVVVIDPGETTQPTTPAPSDAKVPEPSTQTPNPTTSPNIAPPNTTAPNIAPPNTGAPQPTTAPPAPATEPPVTAPAPQGESQLFIVSAGEYAQDIGANLQNAGFVDNATAFVARAIELGVDGKLLVGNFYLRYDDDMDTIIRILTGGSR